MTWRAGLGGARQRPHAGSGHYAEGAEAAWTRPRARPSPRGPVEEGRLIQQEAIALLRLGRYPQALRRLSQALRTLEEVEGDAAAAQRARLLRLVRVGAPSPEAAGGRRSTGATARSPRPSSRARETRWPTLPTCLDWAYVALGGSRRRSTRIGRSRSRKSSATSTVAGRSTTSAASIPRRTMERNAGARRARTRDLQGSATKQASSGAEHRRDSLRPGQDGGGGAAIPRGPGSPSRGRQPAEDRRGRVVLGRHLARVGGFDEAGFLEESRQLFAEEGDEEDLLTPTRGSSSAWSWKGREPGRFLPSRRHCARPRRSPASPSSSQTCTVSAVGPTCRQETSKRHARRWRRASASHDEDENFGVMSTEYEAAQTLGALVRLRAATDEPRASSRRSATDPAEARGPAGSTSRRSHTSRRAAARAQSVL